MQTVSVIIPTFNRASILSGLLDKLSSQDYPLENIEVLVCSDGSTDDTDNIVESYQTKYSLRLFDTGNSLKFTLAKTRNIGITNAKGDLIIMLDDDMYPDKDFISNHLTSQNQFKNKRVAVFGPRYGPDLDTLAQPECEIEEFWKQINQDTDTHNNMDWTIAKTSNISFVREQIINQYLFDERFQEYGYEDTEFLYRLYKEGFTFVYNKYAKTNHISNFTSEEKSSKLKSLSHSLELMKKIHPEFKLVAKPRKEN